MGVPRGPWGGLGGSLGCPGESWGGPWRVWGGIGGPLGAPEGPFGRPGGLSGVPGSPQGVPWGSQGISRGSLGGPRTSLLGSWDLVKSMKNHCVLLYFHNIGYLGGHWGYPGMSKGNSGDLGGAKWGQCGVLGVSWAPPGGAWVSGAHLPYYITKLALVSPKFAGPTAHWRARS